MVVGYLVAVKLYEPVSGLFSDTDSSGTRIITFLLIFIACILLAALASKLTSKFMDFAGLSWANRFAGAGLGFIKGLLIVLIVVGVLSTFLSSDSGILKKSVTLPYLIKVVDAANHIIPDKLQIRYRGSK